MFVGIKMSGVSMVFSGFLLIFLIVISVMKFYLRVRNVFGFYYI